jgi:hypothetical protein
MCMARANPNSPQVILEKADKIDKKLPFKGECSNVVIDLHMRGKLLRRVSIEKFEFHERCHKCE